jgi:hypothetical protein
MIREIRLGSFLRRYIERRHYLRPLIAGASVGILSGILFGYYLFVAVSPGIIVGLGLVFLSIVFGTIAAAVTAFVFFYLQLYRMSRIVGETCQGCGNEVPKDAEFCPYCGTRIPR